MATGGWFNDAEYSDLTLKLSDGRELMVHKLIICKRNEYFNKLCGHKSQFAEAGMKVIELKDDNPDALEEVLRKIYGCKTPDAAERPWRFWLDVVLIADKYLEPFLSTEAGKRFKQVAVAEQDTDTIFDIVQAVKAEMDHLQDFLDFAEKLRKDNVAALLSNQKYRASLDADKELLWSQLDELVPLLANGVPANAVKKRTFTCSRHEKEFVVDDVEDKTLKRMCNVCTVYRKRDLHLLPVEEGRTVYIFK